MSELQTPPEGTEQENVTPQADVEIETPQTPSEAVETPQEPTEPASPEPQPEPYKEKFIASQRESILNNERVRVATARIESLTKQDTPTDEAMRLLYPEWDQLDQYNKNVLIRQETIAMQATRVSAEQQQILDRLKLEDELDIVIDTTPKLKGKEADFKKFARNPKNRGISADVLAKAFLFDAEESAPAAPAPRPTGLPSGNGGPREPLKPKKVSLEEARQIRQTDHKRYMELVKAGAIEDIE